jgi:hypothetical protein
MPKPVRVVPPLEKDIEAKFLRLIRDRKLDVKVRKINGLGYAAWPDRLIIGPRGFIMWLEFKRPKVGKLSPGQEALFLEMGNMGHQVYVHTDAVLAIDELERLMALHGTH